MLLYGFVCYNITSGSYLALGMRSTGDGCLLGKWTVGVYSVGPFRKGRERYPDIFSRSQKIFSLPAVAPCCNLVYLLLVYLYPEFYICFVPCFCVE